MSKEQTKKKQKTLNFWVVNSNPSTSNTSGENSSSECSIKQYKPKEREKSTSHLVVTDQPNQPKNFNFPYKSFGASNHKRSFQSSWFKRFNWIHYDTEKDAAFCHVCQKALQNNLISSENIDFTFTHEGFTNWKSATDKAKGFNKHERCKSHIEAVARYVVIPATSKGDIADLISYESSSERKFNRKMLLLVISSLRFLARQGLPLRGDWIKESAAEENSNMYQLLQLRTQDNPDLSKWLMRGNNKYTSPVIQNEMLETMANAILSEISENIRGATFYSIMADETADVSNKEQLVICIRWVDGGFNVHEELIGMIHLERATADVIVDMLKDTLVRLRLNIHDARGQCYDGASTMSGVKNGVAVQIKSLNGKCLYTHCYGHALNLAVADCVKAVKCIIDSLDTVREVGKLVKKSPQRNTKLDKIRTETANESKGVRTLCPTRWTVRGEALASVLDNHSELMELWDWSLEIVKETDMKARIHGVKSMMTTFTFYFGCSLGEKILKQTDNLSRALQDSSISAAQGYRLAMTVKETLLKDRNDESFGLFWERLLQRRNKEIPVVEEPKLPRKRKAPPRFEIGEQSNNYFPLTPKEHYKQIYFSAIDNVTQCIATRFEQNDFKIYVNVQELLLKSIAGECVEDELDSVIKTYTNDIDKYALTGQLKLLPQVAKTMGFDSSKFDVNDLVKLLQSLDNSQKCLLSEVCTLGKILLVMPATNAVSERSFSALKRVKTYLRSTTGPARLNHLMLVHVHKEKTDSLNLLNIANAFVSAKQNRKQLFGNFSEKDAPRQLIVASKSTQTSENVTIL
jgi:hypothetical protein